MLFTQSLFKEDNILQMVYGEYLVFGASLKWSLKELNIFSTSLLAFSALEVAA